MRVNSLAKISCVPLFLLVLTAAFLFFYRSYSVSADTVKWYYPGSFCQEYSDDNYAYRSYGRTMNQGASTASFVCPIIRHEYSWGIDASYARVRVIDDSSAGDITCTFIIREDDLSAEYSDSFTSTGANSSSPVTYAIDTDIDYDAEDSIAYLVCSIPANQSGAMSGIVWYKVFQDSTI